MLELKEVNVENIALSEESNGMDYKKYHEISYNDIEKYPLKFRIKNLYAPFTLKKFNSKHNYYCWLLKDVRAHCYCASLVRMLFIGHARATSFSSARTELKTQQNIELMTFALTWCANIFVGRSVTPTFFSADRFLF